MPWMLKLLPFFFLSSSSSSSSSPPRILLLGFLVALEQRVTVPVKDAILG